MVILMGKGSIEAKYGLIGLKGLKRIFFPTNFPRFQDINRTFQNEVLHKRS